MTEQVINVCAVTVQLGLRLRLARQEPLLAVRKEKLPSYRKPCAGTRFFPLALRFGRWCLRPSPKNIPPQSNKAQNLFHSSSTPPPAHSPDVLTSITRCASIESLALHYQRIWRLVPFNSTSAPAPNIIPPVVRRYLLAAADLGFASPPQYLVLVNSPSLRHSQKKPWPKPRHSNRGAKMSQPSNLCSLATVALAR